MMRRPKHSKNEFVAPKDEEEEDRNIHECTLILSLGFLK
jgi:hypothetical protein